MAKQTINIGSGELAGNGESIRSAFSKINDNFDELYANGGGGTGVTGPQGPSGAVGPSGADGAVGPTGPAGTGGTSISTSDTAPLTPELGDLWYDTVSGRTYIYYDSGWVDASPAAVGPAGPTGPQGIQGDVGPTGPVAGPLWQLTSGTAVVSLANNGYITLANGAQLYDYGSTSSNGYGITDAVGSTYIGYDPGDTLGALHMDVYNGKNIRLRTTPFGTSNYKDWLFSPEGTLGVPGSILPNADLTYDLGSTSSQWRSLYVGTSTIYLGGVALSVAGGNITIDGSPVAGGGGESLSDRLTSSTYSVILEGTTGTVSVPNAIISQGYQLNLAGSQSSYDIGRYLRVRDGDFESHLHLDTPDNSLYDIILGDDSKFVRVDHTGTVVIGTNGVSSHNWTFGDDGMLTFPGEMTIETEYGGAPTLVIDGKAHTVELRSNEYILIGYNNSIGNVYIGNQTSGQVDIVSNKFRVFAPAPATSAGAAGDQGGQVAFSSTHIYYCTANYSEVTWANTATVDIAGGNGVDNGIAVTLVVVPSVGWSISDGTTTSTINQVVPQGSWYVIFWDNPITFNTGDTVYYGSTAPVQSHIWKRVAWSGDTW